MSSRFEVGQFAEFQRTVTEEHVEQFAALTGDTNPVHLDAEYAATTRFGQRIAHGLIVASMFGTIFGTKLPGEGAVYLGQTLRFKRPVFLGDTVTARVELTELRRDKPIGTFRCVATNQDGDVVVEGEGTLLVP